MNYLIGRPATTTTATPLLSQAVSVKGPGPGAEEKHVRPKPERNMFLSPTEMMVARPATFLRRSSQESHLPGIVQGCNLQETPYNWRMVYNRM